MTKTCIGCGRIEGETAFDRRRRRCRICIAAQRRAAYAKRVGLVARDPAPGEILLPKGRSAWVDPEDAPRIRQFRWWVDGHGYVFRRDAAGRYFRLHREVLGHETPSEIDHRDGDKLNCRRENLRPATRSQNLQNTRPHCDNRCGFKGVNRQSRAATWVARITVNKKPVYLGSFRDPVDAARAYNAAAIRYFGEFARINQI